MVIEKGFYKDRPAITISTKKLTAQILPEDGGKMSSLKDCGSGFEFLCQSPGDKYLRLGRIEPYVDSECSAFDDMFPTIDPYTPVGYDGIPCLDHGEICRLSFDVSKTDDSLTLSAHSELYPVKFSKKITESREGGFILKYSIVNEGEADFPCLWAGHIMLCGALGAKLITCYKPDDEIEMIFSSSPEYGNPCFKRKWIAEPRVDILEPYKSDGTSLKYYFAQPAEKGYCGCEYPGIGRLMFEYSCAKLPYLGVWMNSGKFQGKYNIALEPCTAPYDSPDKARDKKISASIKALSVMEFEMEIKFSNKP